jgi:hypothetical protein
MVLAVQAWFRILVSGNRPYQQLVGKSLTLYTFLDVSDGSAGECEVLPSVADGVGRAGMVQDTCDREQTLIQAC